jgi:RNA polymerase sigma-70 factor (ECF subfamily)
LRHRRPGALQIQAAIAGLHARAVRPEDTDWVQVERLYAALEAVEPSPVVRLNRAVAVAKVSGAAAALEMIEPLSSRLTGYYLFHGARGAFLLQSGRREDARVAFDQAIALAGSAAEAGHIRRHLDRMLRDSERGETLTGR